MLDVFKRKKKLHLVFEYIDHTVLDELRIHNKGSAKYIIYNFGIILFEILFIFLIDLFIYKVTGR